MNEKEKKPKKSNRKGKRNYKKPNESAYTDYKAKGSNDISWYGDPALINAVGKHNFTNPLGKPIGYETYNPNGNFELVYDTANSNTNTSVAGVMFFDVVPSIGMCEAAPDAGNIFTRNFYSFIRHANAGHANYGAPDMGLYVLAIDEIHSHLENLVRAYGFARTFSSMNRYMPTAILRAMNINPLAEGQDMFSNLADFRARLLQLMVKVGTLVVPKDIKFLERHREMYKYIYCDGENAKAQTYLFRPAGFRKYDETSSETGGRLKFESITEPLGVYDYLGKVSDMIEAVMASEDMNIMSGDILKAYGVDGVYKMEYFDELYTVVPTYNAEMLLEIHNLRMVGDPFDDASMDIYQDPELNIIKFTPKFKGEVTSGCVNSVINMPMSDPTPEQVVIATRLNIIGSVGVEEDNTMTFVPDSTGSEIITKGHISQYRFTPTGVVLNTEHITSTIQLDVLQATPLMNRLIRIDAFDWHPVQYAVGKSGDITYFRGCFGEFDNYTMFNRGDLSKIHEMCLVGEFNVPLMGTWSTASKK